MGIPEFSSCDTKHINQPASCEPAADRTSLSLRCLLFHSPTKGRKCLRAIILIPHAFWVMRPHFHSFKVCEPILRNSLSNRNELVSKEMCLFMTLLSHSGCLDAMHIFRCIVQWERISNAILRVSVVFCKCLVLELSKNDVYINNII